MINATKEDKARIVDILMHAFEHNKSVLDIIGERDGRTVRLLHLIEYALDTCTAYGRVLLSEDKNACALVVFPDRKKFTFRSLYRGVKLLVKVTGLFNLPKVLRRDRLIKKQHFLNKIYYVWFIGVFPAEQNLGIGTALLSELLLDARLSGRPVFLETSAPKNLNWYQNHGFELYRQLDLGYPLYFLNRFN